MPAAGLVAIAGGKYTTYRVMAADAIDAAVQFIPARVAPSITEKVSLLGADGYFALVNQAEHVGALQGLHPYRVRHLLDRYGSLISDVLAMAASDPSLLSPITEAPGYLKVEAAYAAAAEGALHLEDILARRMRISIEYPHRGVDCAREVAPRWSRPCSGGPPQTSTARSRTIWRAWRPRCSPRPSPTTFRRTCCGPAHPRRVPRSSSRCLWIEGYAKRVCRAVPPWSMMAVWIRGSTTRRLRVREA